MKDFTQDQRFQQLSEFLSEYDPDESLNFNRVKFRPRAARTTPFGIDITTPTYKKLRLHVAIDSAQSDTTGHKIYAPFEFSSISFLEDYPSFGTLFVGRTNFGFDVRIAHMNKSQLSPATQNALDEGAGISSGELIGECGEEGLSYGRHAHTEIVSQREEFTILDDILRRRVSMFDLYANYNDETIEQFAHMAGITITEAQGLYREEYRQRNIQIINPWLCYRRDYLTQQNRFFYNSMALFGM